jgi:hypothetical protein
VRRLPSDWIGGWLAEDSAPIPWPPAAGTQKGRMRTQSSLARFIVTKICLLLLLSALHVNFSEVSDFSGPF